MTTTDQAARDAQLIAEALTAAGYDPAPAVGQVWHHHTINYLPEGQRRLVRITSVGQGTSGWQCRFFGWIENGDPGDETLGNCDLDTLVAEYALIEKG